MEHTVIRKEKARSLPHHIIEQVPNGGARLPCLYTLRQSCQEGLMMIQQVWNMVKHVVYKCWVTQGGVLWKFQRQHVRLQRDKEMKAIDEEQS